MIVSLRTELGGGIMSFMIRRSPRRGGYVLHDTSVTTKLGDVAGTIMPFMIRRSPRNWRGEYVLHDTSVTTKMEGGVCPS